MCNALQQCLGLWNKALQHLSHCKYSCALVPPVHHVGKQHCALAPLCTQRCTQTRVCRTSQFVPIGCNPTLCLNSRLLPMRMCAVMHLGWLNPDPSQPCYNLHNAAIYLTSRAHQAVEDVLGDVHRSDAAHARLALLLLLQQLPLSAQPLHHVRSPLDLQACTFQLGDSMACTGAEVHASSDM